MAPANTLSFTCDDCGKVYRTRDSLTRHRHNHDKANQHICSVCALEFSRSDILARHIRIHHKGRKRSPRACIPCKLSKMKCDASFPCARCVSSSQDCVFGSEPEYHGRSNIARHRGIIARRSDLSSDPGLSPESISSPAQDQVVSDTQPDSPTPINSPANNVLPGSQPPATVNSSVGDLEASSYEMQIEMPVSACEDSNNMQIEPADITYSQSWATNPWIHPSDLLWSTAESFQQPQELWNCHNIDIGVTDTNDPAPNYEQLQGGVNSASLDSLVIGHSFEDSGARTLTSMRKKPDLLSAPASLFASVNEFLSQPSWLTNCSDISQHSDSRKAYGSMTPSWNGFLNNSVAKTPASMMQRKVVEDLVEFAFTGFPEPTWNQEQRVSYWQEMAPKVAEAFDGEHFRPSEERRVLDNFVKLYFTHFGALWPLLRTQSFDQLTPTVYLITTATGAMYSNNSGRLYGSMMMERILSVLLKSDALYEDTREPSDLESLLIFMLLTQISTLYFGQRRGFSRAQHLGTLIIGQARKANLFNESDDSLTTQPQLSINLQFQRFIRMETRKRIAFGIFRADTFMSAVLNTRPCLSAEEIKLRPPCPDDMWLNTDTSAWQSRDYDYGNNMLYSDLARISMDRLEPLPYLSLLEQDLILFATQESVWRFSHDPEMFDRTIGRKITDEDSVSEESSDDEFSTPMHELRNRKLSTRSARRPDRLDRPARHADHLDCTSRKMSDLKTDYDRTIKALRKWKHSFVSNIVTHQLQTSRYRLLNSRLLYHLSFLRLKADTRSLDAVIADLSVADTDALTVPAHQAAIQRVYIWSHTLNAEQALQHALAIWSLIFKESEWDLANRAKFNILALIALYHAAMVVWAYAGSHEALSTYLLNMSSDDDASSGGGRGSRDLPIYRRNSRRLLACFVDLFRRVTAGWSAVSSFAETVALMAKRPCPVPALAWED